MNEQEFQSRLDAICRDRQIDMRLRFAGNLVARKLVRKDGVQVTYRKYPDLTREPDKYIAGCFFVRDGLTVGYQPQGGVISGNVLPSDLAVADRRIEQVGLPIFVIEQRIRDGVARVKHARYREDCIRKTGIDGMGEFPADGWWEWFDDVNEHGDGCCERAALFQTRCRGQFREPDDSDLERVRQALWFRDQEAQLRDADGPPTMREIEQYKRDRQQAFDKYNEQWLEEASQRVGEEFALAIRKYTNPTVYLDPKKASYEGLSTSDGLDSSL